MGRGILLLQVSLERQNLQKVLVILGQVSPERKNLQMVLEILGQVSPERENLQKVLKILGQVTPERQNLQKVLEILGQHPKTTEKSHPVPENSEANEAPRGRDQDSDQGSQGADPHSFEGDRTEYSKYKHTEETEGRNQGVQSLEKESFVPVAAAQGQHRELQKYSTSGCEGTRGTDSDGLPSSKELEALKARELGEQNFSSKGIQEGMCLALVSNQWLRDPTHYTDALQASAPPAKEGLRSWPVKFGEVRCQRLRLAAARNQEAACPVIPGCSQPQKPHVRMPHVLGETEKRAPAPELGAARETKKPPAPGSEATASWRSCPLHVHPPHILRETEKPAPAPEAGCSHRDQEAACPMIPGRSQPKSPTLHPREDGEAVHLWSRRQHLKLATAW
ncbi:hypothetical protein QTO34_014187 [Cnephaeus nilssonii]|uniref:Uncharacterized protein n=1 Tax=Cnephaeus nilssonii TaxID=3371016 RepID=A0AA40HAX8_CNENI|nr:hypothetical protein QTO34_014187 [Eptesicus nilssonii]